MEFNFCLEWIDQIDTNNIQKIVIIDYWPTLDNKVIIFRSFCREKKKTLAQDALQREWGNFPFANWNGILEDIHYSMYNS